MRRFGMHIHVWQPIDSQLPADHRAAQPEHDHPARQPRLQASRHGAGAGRLVDLDQPDLPRGAAGAGQCPGGTRRDARPAGWRDPRIMHCCSPGCAPGGDPFASAHGVPAKALIPVGGAAMIARPVDALLSSEAIADVTVLTQQPALLRRRRCRPISIFASSVAARPSPPRCEAILADPATRFPLLVTTADHALLDPGDDRPVHARCRPAPIVAIGLVERAAADGAPARDQADMDRDFAAGPIRAPICSRSGRPRPRAPSRCGERSSRIARRAGNCSPRLACPVCSGILRLRTLAEVACHHG